MRETHREREKQKTLKTLPASGCPAAGVRFSPPDVADGRNLLIYSPDTVDPWLFLKPFDTSVWLAMFGTSLFVGIAVLLAGGF